MPSPPKRAPDSSLRLYMGHLVDRINGLSRYVGFGGNTGGSSNPYISPASGPLPAEEGLLGWYDASNTESLILGPDNKVSKWCDMSGRGNDLSQQAVSRQPTYSSEGATPVVQFDGEEDMLTCLDFDGMLNIGGSSFYILLRHSEATLANQVILGGFSSSNKPRWPRLQQLNTRGEYRNVIGGCDARNRGVWYYSDQSRVTNQWRVLSGVFDGANPEAERISFYIDGEEDNLLLGTNNRTMGATTRDTSKIYVGNWKSGNYYWKGNIVEMGIFDRAHTAQEVNRISSLLKDKWSDVC